MPDTASTPTAMRCWSCELRAGRRTARGAGVRLTVRYASTACLVFLALACTKRVTTYYTPTEGERRLSTDEMRDEGDRMLAIECPRLLGASESATADGQVAVDVDRATGAVSRARISRSTGDTRIDDIFGALAARLDFDPPAGATSPMVTERIGVGYSCSRQSAVMTLSLPGETAPP